MKLGPNIAVFIIFFSISLVEAFQDKNFILAFLFLLLGLLFLKADNLKKDKGR